MIVAGMLIENLGYIGLPISDTATPTLVTLICFVVYVVLVYIESWRTGQRDYNLVMHKRAEYSRYKPTLAALVSQLPGIILAALAFFPSSGVNAVKYLRYFYLNFNYFLLAYGEKTKAVYLVPVIFPLIIAPTAYKFGYRDFRILNRLMFVNPDKAKKKNGK